METDILTDRRTGPRWKAASHQHRVDLVSGGGRTVTGMLIDISAKGMGIRADRGRFAAGMRVRVETDLLGGPIQVQGVVRHVDRFFPRIGVQIDAADVMAKLLSRAEAGGFLMTRADGDTLALSGSLTLAGLRELGATTCRRLDLSRVSDVSVAGAGIVSLVAGKGARIACCSEPIAPLFDALGICRAGYCVSATPCDLPKAWPTGRVTAD